MKNSPVVVASAYNFSPQKPGGSISIGSNSFTLTPCPLGVSSALPFIELVGGVGTAEAAPITGGTCTSGAASGSIIVTAANTHSGAWTAASASGGTQEAICALPSGGGQVVLTTNLTLNANVTTCGKTGVVVNRLAGVTVTNASSFTIFGTNPTGFAQAAYAHTVPAWASLSTLYNGTQFDIGGYPDNFQNGFTSSGVVQSLVGTVNVTTNPSSGMNVFGVAGYSRTTVQNGLGVAVYGGGTCGGALTQCWGGNFDVQHDSGGAGGGAMVGAEIDVGHSASGAKAAATLKGVTSVLLGVTNPTGFSHAFEAIRASPSFNQWNTGYEADAGCCNVAFISSPTHESNNSVSSMPIYLIGRDGVGTTHNTQLQADASGNLNIQAATNQSVNIGPGPTSTTVAFNSSGASVMSTTGSIIVGQLSATTIMLAIDTGANNAIAGTVANPPALATGLRISVLLTHTLQAGANTFAYNGGAAVAIKSHRNLSNNIATGYTNGIVDLIYDGTQWEDLSQ